MLKNNLIEVDGLGMTLTPPADDSFGNCPLSDWIFIHPLSLLANLW